MTHLYRHLDAAGRLLYVGISQNAAARLSSHGVSGWAKDIATIKIDTYPTRWDAMVAEAKAIREERPPHNALIPKDKSPRTPRTTGKRGTISLRVCGPISAMILREIDGMGYGAQTAFIESAIVGFVGHKHPDLLHKYAVLQEEATQEAV